jgi:multidrug transporter EmrE-like cation transporter
MEDEKENSSPIPDITSKHLININNTNDERPSDSQIRSLSFKIVLIAIVLLSIMLYFASITTNSSEINPSSPVGWIAVAGSSFIFGTTGILRIFFSFLLSLNYSFIINRNVGIPMKSPSLKNLKVDSFVYSLYNCIGIFVTSIPLIIYLLCTNSQLKLQYFGILGAVNIFVISYFAFKAVQLLGYSIAPSIWAGIGMISSFIWGTTLFEEKVASFAGGACSIIILTIGVYVISTLSNDTSDTSNTINKLNDNEIGYELACVHIENPEIIESKKEKAENDSNTFIRKYYLCNLSVDSYYGFIFCLLTGLCDGAMMVPVKLSSMDDLDDALSYIASFAIASILIAPFLLALYYAYNQYNFPQFHFKEAFLPGFFSGSLWCLANFMSVHSTYYLVN